MPWELHRSWQSQEQLLQQEEEGEDEEQRQQHLGELRRHRHYEL